MKRWGLMLALVVGYGVAFAAPVVIDQFNDGKKENALGGATGAWFDPEDKSIYCRAENDPAVFFGLAGQSLALRLADTRRVASARTPNGRRIIPWPFP